MELELGDLPEPLRARAIAAPKALERLASMIAEAGAASPTLAFSPAEYAAYVLERVPADVDLVSHLSAVHAPDLLIAHRCALGDDRAVVAFERRCFDEIVFAVARVRSSAMPDEIAQMMREHLFVSKNGAPPKIVQYTGTGDLRSWFRIVLVRQLLNQVKRVHRETELDDALLEALPAAATDPELDHARRMYAPVLRDALVAAIANLERRDRTLLRLAVCDSLSVDGIGALYGVHRATAARWVAAARERLEEGTRAELRNRLGAHDESVASLFRLLASQVQLSLRGHLMSQGPPPER